MKNCLAMQIWGAQYEKDPNKKVSKYLDLLHQPLITPEIVLDQIKKANYESRRLRVLAQRDKIRAERRSTIDPLTGLDNRRKLDSRLKEELARYDRHNSPLSLAMVDLDHFKLINDIYGHQAGDYVLETIASLMRKHLRKEDLLARYGGEEFTVVFLDTPLDGAVIAAEHLRKSVEQYEFNFNGEKIAVTTSIGLSRARHLDSPNSLVARADTALYSAKAFGRNCVHLSEE